ncbi:MAG: hypothetical protein OJF52_001393 [Nitrospira sp.]|jgi:hypothetical protein|nr:MAG: hypothetical protein OJF52_001393 [Nitrospira sp.]
MAVPPSITDSVLRLSPRIELFPILHGSGDVAQEVRDRLIDRRCDCLAVPLPPSFERPLEEAVADLPTISLVVQQERGRDGDAAVNYVPVDPCQAVIMGIRVAMGEGIPRAYIDREVTAVEPAPFVSPDAYVLKHLSYEAFAAALVPTLVQPAEGTQQQARIAWTAFQLHQLEMEYEHILCLCHLADWPWIRQAYGQRADYHTHEPTMGRPERYLVDPASLYFVLGELPFLTELYERRRATVHSDRHLSIDGIKELLLETRGRWQTAHDEDGRTVPDWVTPQLLQSYLQYVRNHALLDRRLTPDLYTLVLAAKQMAGDDFAIHLLETAKSYAYQAIDQSHLPRLSAGLGQVELPDDHVVRAVNRLQGTPLVWRSLSLRPRPPRRTSRRWSYLWNPHRQCSWPPEDSKIESFHTHVREQAKAIIGSDLAKSEKFTTSMKDGIDLRESLRHWHQRQKPGNPKRLEIYVKEIPPARGNVDTVIFLFDTPADPDTYSWQATWYAEHAQESTLCFYATPFLNNMVAPGIGQSRYGGALFIFPPCPIPDIWTDEALGFAKTLEERLIAAGAVHSRETHLALVTPVPPKARWRQIAGQFDRRLVPIPLSRFSGQLIDRLRRFHVLNGHDIRSFAAQFIRE